MSDEAASQVPPQSLQQQPEQRPARQNNQGHHRPNTNNNNRGGGGRRYGGNNGASGDSDGRPRRDGQHRNNQNRTHRPRPASGFNHLITQRKDHAGVPMSGNVTDCLICCQPSDVFGVGECRHPVCMECCIRMRILGNSESCHQCRSPIALLYFISAPNSWDNFSIPMDEVKHEDSSKYNIRFTNDYTVKCYNSYTAHSCSFCLKNGDKAEFPHFGALRHHTAQVHQKTFCPICIEHLNILSKDRVAYGKIELERHMKGSLNEITGQKGHPPCLFCPERFYDDDYLYRHLRQEHFFCQICEGEGSTNIFYPKVEELYAHYRKKHHPCNEPDCKAMGIVFRTDVELGVHKASEHGSASRSVNIDFQFSGRNLGNRIPRSGAQSEREPPLPRRTERISVIPNEAPPPSSVSSISSVIVPSAQNQTATIVRSRFIKPTEHEFPSLGPSASQSSGGPMPNWRQEVQASRRPAPPPQSLDTNSGAQFPSLGGSSNSASLPSNQAQKGNKNSATNSVWGKGQTKELFKEKPPAPKPPPQEVSRRRFIALPDIFPEGIRERVEAKQQGLPDPGGQEPEDPLLAFTTRKEREKKEKRKEAKEKKRSKTIPITSLANSNVDNDIVHTSKFGLLEELDEDKKKSKSNKTSKKEVPTLQNVADSIGQQSSGSSKKEITPEVNNPPKKEDAPQVNGIAPSSAILDYQSAYPSLTSVVGNLLSFGRSNTSSKTNYTTQPPPGFS